MLVWLTGTNMFIRRFQNVLSCGLDPTWIAVAQGPYWFVMLSFLSQWKSSRYGENV